jgi:isocitrate dehydrogenase (NAD+)
MTSPSLSQEALDAVEGQKVRGSVSHRSPMTGLDSWPVRFPTYSATSYGMWSLQNSPRAAISDDQESVFRMGSDGDFRQSAHYPCKMSAIMTHKITLLPGDGIGPEVANAARQIVEATGVSVEWEVFAAPLEEGKRVGEFPREQAVESVRRTHVALKGPMATAVAEGPPSINVALRKELDLYANLRPVRNMAGVASRWAGVDLVIVRENTEDLYAGLEHTVIPGVVESLKIITEHASTRIARFAFEYARKNGRKKIHAIHKANIMKLSDGLFLNSIRAVAEKYPDIEYRELIVDNACMQLVLNPAQFDVLLLPNLYGDVVSDLAAGLVGGLGVVASGNIGDVAALFEAVHGTAPDIVGKGIANPTAIVMSAAMMLNYLNEAEASRRILSALDKVYREGKHTTRDVGGTATTQEFTQAVIAQMARQ